MSYTGRALSALMLVFFLGSAAAGAVAEGWTDLVRRGEEAGLETRRMERTVNRLAETGVAPEEAAPFLEPAFEAARQGLPAGVVLAKIEEGALKRVPTEAMESAARKRLQVLVKARDMLDRHGYTADSEAKKGLLVASALALESGMEEPSLGIALSDGVGKPYGQVKAVVEAGEMFRLSGLEPGTVGALMADCLQRNLRRVELTRIVRSAREKHRGGLRGDSLRQALWGDSGSSVGGMGNGSRVRPSGSMGSGGDTGVAPGAGGSSSQMGGSRPPRGGHR